VVVETGSEARSGQLQRERSVGAPPSAEPRTSEPRSPFYLPPGVSFMTIFDVLALIGVTVVVPCALL
jgi:hypothetical protein